MKQYDAIIIGFGKGGKLLAAELSERNWKVAIVERSPQMYGGTCVNVGCISFPHIPIRESGLWWGYILH